MIIIENMTRNAEIVKLMNTAPDYGLNFLWHTEQERWLGMLSVITSYFKSLVRYVEILKPMLTMIII